MSLAELFYHRQALRAPFFRRKRGKTPTRAGRKFQLEALEPRLLLSADAIALPQLEQVQPAGSLIHEASVSGSLDAVGEIDTVTMTLDPGQTISAVFTPQASTLRGELDLRAPGGASLGLVQASGEGQRVLLQTLPVAQSGTYSLNVHSLVGTGAYSVQVFLNSALEPESFGGTTNNDLLTAFSLNESAITLQGTADRLAVRGVTEAGTPDVYRFDLVAGQPATLALFTDTFGGAVTVELLDENGTLLASGVTGPTNVHRALQNFIAPATGSYFARIAGAANQTYTLVVTRGVVLR